jgi:ParB family chromosome partitioning protein
MSLKDKASRINFGVMPDMASPTSAGAPGAAGRPKTAPGLMMAHAADQRSELLRENESLKAQVAELGADAARAAELADELKAWDGAKANRLLDPKLVTWSQWANRDESNFTGAEFLELKNEIASAGGNVQAIKVRPLKPGSEFEYEIVFGHRRHRACLELGLPVLADIDNLGEIALFVQMDRENRGRKNLSAWEQGKMYLRALDRGLFPSNRQLAENVGVDLTQVGKALALARLPKEVIEAFASPLEIQFRWAKPLADASECDPAGLTARALKAKDLGPSRTAKAVLALLVGEEGEGGRTVLPPPVVIERDGKKAATIELDAKGRATVSFAEAVVSAKQLKALGEMIQAFLAKGSRTQT